MRRSAPFRDIDSAPKDGSAIEVRHGPGQEIVRAEWSGQAQAWIQLDDPLRRTLHRVTGWRRVAQPSASPNLRQAQPSTGKAE